MALYPDIKAMALYPNESFSIKDCKKYIFLKQLFNENDTAK